MKPENLKEPIRPVSIDCDLVKGTAEVLDGIIRYLTIDGIIFNQNYQTTSIRAQLKNKKTWDKYCKGIPEVKKTMSEFSFYLILKEVLLVI
jgi:hypothetical protein